MKITEYKVHEVKCVDEGKTRGVVIGCEGRNIISLVFNAHILHKQTDELARTLQEMGLLEVVVQSGY